LANKKEFGMDETGKPQTTAELTNGIKAAYQGASQLNIRLGDLLTRLRGPEPEVKDQDPRSSEALRDMVAKTTETLDKCSELLNCIENLI
tara:strand:+ start:210 stop:479 length:270 start_codon:yes stop_codon:yes gene_type:complete